MKKPIVAFLFSVSFITSMFGYEHTNFDIDPFTDERTVTYLFSDNTEFAQMVIVTYSEGSLWVSFGNDDAYLSRGRATILIRFDKEQPFTIDGFSNGSVGGLWPGDIRFWDILDEMSYRDAVAVRVTDEGGQSWTWSFNLDGFDAGYFEQYRSKN